LRNIEFSKAAQTAFSSLSVREKKKAIGLLDLTNTNIQDLRLNSKIYKLKMVDRQMYALRLSDKLRVIIEINDTEIRVVDILNHDLFVKYFNNSI
jgi:mRNA-degrading endonuclease RelE of RelBE toxin-antitoxin system